MLTFRQFYKRYQILDIYNNLEPISMSLYEKVQDKIKQKLSSSPSQADVPKFISLILQDFPIEGAFHQIDLSSVKQPKVLFTQLMVQDIRQNCYMYPFVVEKPFSEKSKSFFFGYGNKQVDFDHNLLQNPDYFSYLADRQTISCVSIAGETQWVKQVEKSQLKENQMFEMITDRLNLFKLGEVFSAICVYEPQEKLLYFVRNATEGEIKTWTNLQEYLNKQVNFQDAREKLLKIFGQLYSEKYSHYLMYSFLATDHFFLSAFQNHSSLFRKLLPTVTQIKIKSPFNQSLFPYKNEEDQLVKTCMQMSNLQTYVILDFSNLCNNQQVKIGPEEIDNLKALKVFVEQGNTIYRWAYGESQIKHNHTGVIVRASSIISPQYVILQPHNQQTKNQLPQISSQDLRLMRSYIQQVRKINPTLKDDLKAIETAIHSQEDHKFNETALVKVMQLSKLNAKSYGRDEIKMKDFENSCSIFF